MKVTNYYLGISSHKINNKNPFMGNLFEMEVSTKTKVIAGNKEAMNNIVVDRNSGDVLAHQVFAVKQKVDTEQFTKVFNQGLAAMWGLTTSGIKVFTYIADQVKPNSDFVYFDVDDAKAFTGYKTNKSVLQGLGQLLDASFIARTTKYYKYFINPTFFFNGSRLTLINHYEVDPTLKPSDAREEVIEDLQIKLKLPPTE